MDMSLLTDVWESTEVLVLSPWCSITIVNGVFGLTLMLIVIFSILEIDILWKHANSLISRFNSFGELKNALWPVMKTRVTTIISAKQPFHTSTQIQLRSWRTFSYNQYYYTTCIGILILHQLWEVWETPQIQLPTSHWFPAEDWWILHFTRGILYCPVMKLIPSS